MFILIDEQTILNVSNVVAMKQNGADPSKWDVHLNGEASITPITVDLIIKNLIVERAGGLVGQG